MQQLSQQYPGLNATVFSSKNKSGYYRSLLAGAREAKGCRAISTCRTIRSKVGPTRAAAIGELLACQLLRANTNSDAEP
jgi:hypothetical protein